MPVTPDKIKGVKPTMIIEDRPCKRCGYNLVGLMSDGVCPECGHPIHTKRKKVPRYSDNLVNAPLSWIAVLAGASLTMFVVSIPLFISTVLAAALSSNGAKVPPVVATMLALIWSGACWVATRPRPVMPSTVTPPHLEGRKMRWAARLSQFAWIGAGLFIFAYSQSSTAGGGLLAAPQFSAICAIACLAVAILGLIPLCISVSDLAYWASDFNLGDGFRMCAWSIGFGSFLLLLHTINIHTNSILMGGFLGSLVFILLMIFAVSPFLYFIVCLVQFQSITRWAMSNHAKADARTQRLREQAERNASRPALVTPPVVEGVDLDSFNLGDSTVDPTAQQAMPKTHIVQPSRPVAKPKPASAPQKDNHPPKGTGGSTSR